MSEHQEQKRPPLWLVIVIVSLVWLAVGVAPQVGVWKGYYSEPDLASFGGSFDFVSSLFSGLAFAGVVYAKIRSMS